MSVTTRAVLVSLTLVVLVGGGWSRSQAADKMYWTQPGLHGAPPGTILRADLSGSNVETILSGVDSFGIDIAGGKLYFADLDAAEIRRANPDGTGIETVIGGVQPHTLEVDTTGGKVYWAEGSSPSVIRRRMQSAFD